MSESSSRRRRVSKEFREHLFLNSRISKYGRCIVALWPDNPAKMLAEKLDTTERNANQIISGDRKVTARALVIVMDEID